MLPVLFKVFGFEVRAYGVLLALGLFAAVAWSRARARKFGIEPDKVLDAAFWGIVPGILFARIGFIVQEWDYYSQHTDKLWSLRFEGLTSFGGVVGALAGLVVFCRIAKIETRAFLDTVSAPLLVAHGIGRLGCLLNGCCYGRATKAWYGVHVEGVAGLFTPAQLFDTFYVLVGVCLMLLYERKVRSLGRSFALSVLLWGVARFIYEFARAGTIAEVERGAASSTYWGSSPFTEAQAAAVAMVVIGGVLWYLFGRAKEAQ